MMRRMISLIMGTLVVAVLCAFPVFATEVFEGQVLSAGNGKITIQNLKKKTSTFDVAIDARITRDGKEAKLEAVKNTDAAKVTTNNRMAVTVIEARSGKASVIQH